MATLHQGAHFTLQHHAASGYVRLIRSALPFDSPDDAVRALHECAAALAGFDVDRMGILLDWRLGPFSTDPRLHREVVAHTDAFACRFRRRAVLVTTPVGQMQMGRIIRNESTTSPVAFNDENAAIEYVSFGGSLSP